MPIDLARARHETPGIGFGSHLNAAGAALMPRPVIDAVQDHLALEARIGGYEAADARQSAVERTYDAIAALLNCRGDEVAIVENATRAWDMAFYGIALGPGDRILTTRAEYGSNFLAILQVCRRTGALVEVIDDDSSGQLSVTDLERRLDERVKVVAVTHVPTNGGLVNPASAVGAALRGTGVLYMLDACQSVGQMPLDVDELGCDVLTGTSRKFLRGPRGVGFLYTRRSILEQLEPPFIDIHAAHWDGIDTYTIRPDARRFENWETNYATKIGLGVAVDYASSWGLGEIRDRVACLAARLREQLADLPGVAIHDRGAERCAIVSFSVLGVDPGTVAGHLAERGIRVSISDLASTRVDMAARGYDAWLRASVHYYNAESDVDALVQTLATLRV